MYVKKTKGPNFVELPDGRKFSRSDLPPKSTTRWVASRKASVVLAVSTGLITNDEACEMYQLSREEFEGWVTSVKVHGVGAVSYTHLTLPTIYSV